MSNPKDMLEKLGASALKGFSQNFLTSDSHAKKMVGAVLEGETVDEYWEIGPGLGALTKHFAEMADKPITLFEFDRKLSAFLRKEYPQLTLVEGDFLNADFTSLGDKKIAILSNLPYHISTQILLKLLPEKAHFPRMVFSFQKEYAEKLSAKTRTKEYGSLSILMQLNYEMENILTLPPSVFFPAPNVDSSVVRFTPKPAVANSRKLESFVRTAFSHRRKKLSSNLKSLSKEKDWDGLLTNLGFNPNTRAEELSPLEFIQLLESSGL